MPALPLPSSSSSARRARTTQMKAIRAMPHASNALPARPTRSLAAGMRASAAIASRAPSALPPARGRATYAQPVSTHPTRAAPRAATAQRDTCASRAQVRRSRARAVLTPIRASWRQLDISPTSRQTASSAALARHARLDHLSQRRAYPDRSARVLASRRASNVQPVSTRPSTAALPAKVAPAALTALRAPRRPSIARAAPSAMAPTSRRRRTAPQASPATGLPPASPSRV